jgi:hypothetical protein
MERLFGTESRKGEVVSGEWSMSAFDGPDQQTIEQL